MKHYLVIWSFNFGDTAPIAKRITASTRGW